MSRRPTHVERARKIFRDTLRVDADRFARYARRLRDQGPPTQADMWSAQLFEREAESIRRALRGEA